MELDESKEIKEIRDEIEMNKKREKEVKSEIIEKIHIGIFEVETKEVSDYISEKYAKIAKGLTKVIANRVTAITNTQLEHFERIQEKINKPTGNIEEASELKEFLETTGTTEVEKLRVEINKNAEIYNILEEEKYRLEPIQM